MINQGGHKTWNPGKTLNLRSFDQSLKNKELLTKILKNLEF